MKVILDTNVFVSGVFFSGPPYLILEAWRDDKFLACALASKSKIIISSDKHLLNVSGYEEIEVLKPRDFLEKHLK